MYQWFADKFVNPLCHYYTLEATLTYGVILVLAVWGTYNLLQKLKIKIDKRFFIGLLPFIVYGGWTRALRDHLLGYSGWWWCSPPIYFLIFGIGIASLLAGVYLERKTKKSKYRKYFQYHKVMFAVGIILSLYNLTLTKISNFYGISVILLLVGIWSVIFFGFHHLKPKLLSLQNAGITVAHLLDASATFTALTFFGYYEQHVLPGFLIDIFGPWVMFPLKIIVVLAVLYALDKYCEDKFLRNFLKIVVLILGLALGVRDMLTVGMLV